MNIAIIGAGGISKTAADAINFSKKVNLYAIASRSEQKAKDFAEKFNIPNYYSDYDALLNDKNVEGVYIGVTHNAHYEIAKKCLQKGLPVICEKPCCLNESQMKELCDLATKNNVTFMEAMWVRFLPAYRQVKRWIKEGAIGEVKTITSQFCFNSKYNPKSRLYAVECAGGALYDAGVYPIEFVLDIADSKLKELSSFSTFAPNGVDNNNVLSMKFENDVLANVTCSFVTRTGSYSIIGGSEGKIVIPTMVGMKKCELYNNSEELIGECYFDFEHKFVYEIEHFYDLCKSGKVQSDIMDWEDNLECTRIFEKVLNK